MNEQEFLKVLIEAVPTIKSEEEIRKGFTYLSQHEDDMNLLTEAVNTFKVAKDEKSRNTIKTIWDKATGSVTIAKLGAKLNYIQALKGKCPEGTELYKSGGRVECRKCGGSTKVKPTGKKRFLSKGDNIEFEQADVNLPIPRSDHALPLKKTLITGVPFGNTYVETIHFDSKSPTDPKSVSEITIKTPQGTDTLYTISPERLGRYNKKRAEQIYKAHQSNKKK